MENLSLTPATQAVLDALTELGQGNVHELADKAGKARSTTDKAIKTLADAGLIAAVDTDADPAEGTPTRWTPATPTEATDAAPDDPGGEHTANPDETAQPDGTDLDNPAGEPDTGDTEPADQTGNEINGDEDADEEPDDTADETDRDDASNEGPDDEDSGADDEGRTVAVVQPTRPGDRKVMAIKGVLADYSDAGATLDLIVAESGIGHVTATRLLTAMEQADAARRLPGEPQRWIPGPTKASEVDPNPEPPRCPLCLQVMRGLANTPTATAAVQPLVRPDGTLHIVGPDGETHVVTLPTRATPRTASTARTVGRVSGDGTVNADGNQPFGRGELEKLTLDYLAASPGRQMTPQDIASALAAQLNRQVSNGAVRNNLTKAAAAGRILLVSDNPLAFVHPAPADSGAAAEADADNTDQS
ncbi:helix-turn-helix domain-containing protein [Verrucosispora sp. WMMA2121]|uniref:helix-turn-helix domain-containing protein n=1 Tax=Verrucosispora sp. WMMA2121 TaxID=3015164 RepID=UPI0022B65902|nr:helix-turn-helix domain-containing protein [Verrucosispora sp. WMMA2121]MCZ7423775.1 helix-turn-helix domain-containing protein [Verrucosispora sp. WMMA2121]MCZ7424083.1 helix-turn-helix domain-containing protein [Verrucosispora sp. WMMA2121]MCZ7424098.1 helix-turn-helix domain-containing protein [Verrucosispora sp. WMMA2121]